MLVAYPHQVIKFLVDLVAAHAAEIVAARIEEQAGKRSNLIDKPMPAADMEYTYANIDRAKELLGYAPKVSVEQGVREFYRWYQNTVLGGGGG